MKWLLIILMGTTFYFTTNEWESMSKKEQKEYFLNQISLFNKKHPQCENSTVGNIHKENGYVEIEVFCPIGGNSHNRI